MCSGSGDKSSSYEGRPFKVLLGASASVCFITTELFDFCKRLIECLLKVLQSNMLRLSAQSAFPVNRRSWVQIPAVPFWTCRKTFSTITNGSAPATSSEPLVRIGAYCYNINCSDFFTPPPHQSTCVLLTFKNMSQPRHHNSTSYTYPFFRQLRTKCVLNRFYSHTKSCSRKKVELSSMLWWTWCCCRAYVVRDFVWQQ